MLLGLAIRSIIQPISTPLIYSRSTTTTPLGLLFSPPTCNCNNTSSRFRFIQSLTDTRFPKRRPLDNINNKPPRKRATLNPPGPYAWVKHVPGEPIPANQPNVGSVKRRNEKKRIKLRKAFILAEKKQRKAQLQEANKKKKMKKIERKMAAVARDRAWAERLAELQQIEEDKKAAAAAMT
ncbi:uncharacterized protein LOC143602396 [Bidens hawaiensis]|uniref:uncharacterized protein LOC143602396 n=1 Tax=Bidens hawaiensis TaxID=980011 RepID=UPI00404AE273